MGKNLAFLKAAVDKAGIDLVGVADIRGTKEYFHQLPSALLDQLPLAIVIGLRLSSAVLASVETGPTLVYFHHYRQINSVLDQAALKIAHEITASGHLAMPIAASQLVDWDKQIGHVSHKALAERAGMGWRGRNNLLVTERFGAQVRLASILTDLPLEAGQALKRDCGTCRRCISVCPGNAIKENAADFDGVACYGQIRQFVKTLRLGQNICGLCVRACPRAEAGG